jgi:galactose-1-phosphate uridylyltransferase
VLSKKLLPADGLSFLSFFWKLRKKSCKSCLKNKKGGRMKFEAIERETVILDPNNNMERKSIPSQIRKDPLTGRTSRICHFMALKWEKPDFDQLIAGTEKICPFCPDKVMKVTPCFPEDIVPEGRLSLEDKVLFPNIAPYDSLGAVATLGDRHFIPMTDFETQRIADGFRLSMKFFRRVKEIHHPESVYHLVSWNYMPASGSTLIHPHFQVFATAYAPNQLREELQAAKTYMKKNGTNYWDDLVAAEEKDTNRFLGRIGRINWLTVFAPLGVAGDVVAIVDGTCSTLELTDDDLYNLANGLTKLMAAYDKMGIYNFNVSFFAGTPADNFTRFHLVFSPRTFFSQALGTPDVAALRNLGNEGVCMAFPEDINKMLISEF